MISDAADRGDGWGGERVVTDARPRGRRRITGPSSRPRPGLYLVLDPGLSHRRGQRCLPRGHDDPARGDPRAGDLRRLSRQPRRSRGDGRQQPARLARARALAADGRFDGAPPARGRRARVPDEADRRAPVPGGDRRATRGRVTGASSSSPGRPAAHALTGSPRRCRRFSPGFSGISDRAQPAAARHGCAIPAARGGAAARPPTISAPATAAVPIPSPIVCESDGGALGALGDDVADRQEARGPGAGARDVVHQEAAVRDVRGAGQERRDRPRDADEAAEDDRLAAVRVEDRPRRARRRSA